MDRFEKTVRGLLFLQVALMLFVGAAYWIGLEGFSDGDVESRKVTAFMWGFAVLLLMAGLRLPQNPRWIQPVIAVVVLNWLDSTYELFAQGNANFLQPFILEGILGTVYIGYAVSTGGPRGRSRLPSLHRKRNPETEPGSSLP